MPTDGEVIRGKRSDLTDWLLHWTKPQHIDGKHHTALQVLQVIVQCGYLQPTVAPRRPLGSSIVGSEKPRIEGDHPAVCFTDQTLRAFLQSCHAPTFVRRYYPYALAFKKRDLYAYGARPVIYAEEDMLLRLKPGDLYRWVHYKPDIPPWERRYQIDWTHEREWRTKVWERYWGWGVTPKEGVPLVLASVDTEGNEYLALPRILVPTVDEARTLRAALTGLPAYEGDNHLIKHLYAHVHEITIIPLDLVLERLRAGQSRWGKLETLPKEEVRAALDPELACGVAVGACSPRVRATKEEPYVPLESDGSGHIQGRVRGQDRRADS